MEKVEVELGKYLYDYFFGDYSSSVSIYDGWKNISTLRSRVIVRDRVEFDWYGWLANG